MSSHNFDINYGSFLHGNLKSDGSNFIDWYQRPRDTLNGNDLLYLIQEPLADAPGTPRVRMIMVITVISLTFP
jgi:hypothetical protein